MKRLTFLCFALLFMVCAANAQNILKEAPAGFDVYRADIPHGKLDSISYSSTTVGVKRKALVYTPPGYSKTKNTLYCICCMVLAATKRNG